MFLLIILPAAVLATVLAENGGCEVPAVLNTKSGIISSPYYNSTQHPTPYPDDLTCRWTITIPPGQGKNIRIAFSAPMAFQVGVSSCLYDWVALFPSNRPSSEEICSRPLSNATAGPYCSVEDRETRPFLTQVGAVPRPFVLAGNSIDVEFCSDNSVGRRGFRLEYTGTDDAPTAIPPRTFPPAAQCGGSISVVGDEPQYLVSPNYPDLFEGAAACVWLISIEPGSGLSFRAENFFLEQSLDLAVNPLLFTDITDHETGRSVIKLGSLSHVGVARLRSVGNVVFSAPSLTAFQDRDTASFESGSRNVNVPSVLTSAPIPVRWRFASRMINSATVRRRGKVDCPGGTDEFCPQGCGIPARQPLLSTSTESRINGGVEARPHSWPWTVSLVGGRHLCGGSIIDHHWIVTAAHCCFIHRDPEPTTYRIRVGEHDMENGSEPNAWTYEVEKLVPHPRFHNVVQNDICLIKTKMPIFFNEDVSPICIGSDVDPPTDTECYAIGWGSTVDRFWSLRRGLPHQRLPFDDPRWLSALRQADLKLFDFARCKAALASVPGLALTVEDNMICAFNPGKDTCQGDSGGSLVCRSVRNADRWELIGVVSWGEGCADPKSPGMYAKVSHFLDWIAETVMTN